MGREKRRDKKSKEEKEVLWEEEVKTPGTAWCDTEPHRDYGYLLPIEARLQRVALGAVITKRHLDHEGGF